MAYRLPGIIPVYDIMGNLAGSRATGLGNSYNPVAQLTRAKDNRVKNNRVFGNAYVELNILNGLTARSSFGIDYAYNTGYNFSFVQVEASEPGTQNGMSEFSENQMNWTFSNTLNYKRIINDIHNLSILIGTEAINDTYRSFNASRQSFFSLDVDYRYLSAGQANINNSGAGASWALFSLFGRVDYNLGSKYLASLTMRRDGSSRFGENNRYAAFPAVSLGWVLSEEGFMKNVAFINNLKLRAGWGKTGNQDIGNYAAYSTYLTSPITSYDATGSNSSLVSGFAVSALGNSNLKWETTTSNNIGLDFSILSNKIDGSIDVYKNITSDMLYRVPLLATAGGAQVPYQNIGKMSNTGLDLMVNYHAKIGEELNLNIGANFSTYRNEVLKLDESPNTFITGGSTRPGTFSRIERGHPVSAFYTYVLDGIFQDQAEVDAHAVQEGKKVGAFRLKDVNGDGVINGNDQTWVGSPHPDFTYGLNIGLNYKNFDFTLFFQGNQGNDLVNATRWWNDFDNFGGNRSVRMLDTWSETNRDAKLARLDRTMTKYDTRASTYYVEDGSYLRLKNVQLGYTFAPQFLEKLKLANCRLYIQGINLLTFTKYTGLDPEIYNTTLGYMGIDQGPYPTTRSVNVGLNLGF